MDLKRRTCLAIIAYYRQIHADGTNTIKPLHMMETCDLAMEQTMTELINGIKSFPRFLRSLTPGELTELTEEYRTNDRPELYTLAMKENDRRTSATEKMDGIEKEVREDDQKRAGGGQ